MLLVVQQVRPELTSREQEILKSYEFYWYMVLFLLNTIYPSRKLSGLLLPKSNSMLLNPSVYFTILSTLDHTLNIFMLLEPGTPGKKLGVLQTKLDEPIVGFKSYKIVQTILILKVVDKNRFISFHLFID